MRDELDFENTFFSYYRMYEKDFFDTEEYIAIDNDNSNAYSVIYGKLLLNICGEIDSIMKEMCAALKPQKKVANMVDYWEVISEKFPNFTDEMVILYNKKITLQPWKDWNVLIDSDRKKTHISPDWWSAYNLIKHHRAELNSKTGKENFKLANQINILNSLTALYILEQYTIYAYYIRDANQEKAERMFLSCKSKHLQIHMWSGCYTFFMGYDNFNFELLKKIINNKRE